MTYEQQANNLKAYLRARMPWEYSVTICNNNFGLFAIKPPEDDGKWLVNVMISDGVVIAGSAKIPLADPESYQKVADAIREAVNTRQPNEL